VTSDGGDEQERQHLFLDGLAFPIDTVRQEHGAAMGGMRSSALWATLDDAEEHISSAKTLPCEPPVRRPARFNLGHLLWSLST